MALETVPLLLLKVSSSQIPIKLGGEFSFIKIRKQKLLKSISKNQDNFQTKVLVLGLVLDQFTPICPKQSLEKYEGDRTQFKPEKIV